MRLTRRIAVRDPKYTLKENLPVTATTVESLLRTRLGLTAEAPDIRAESHKVQLDIVSPDALTWHVCLQVDVRSQLSDALGALDAAQSRLHLVAVDAPTPGWAANPGTTTTNDGGIWGRPLRQPVERGLSDLAAAMESSAESRVDHVLRIPTKRSERRRLGDAGSAQARLIELLDGDVEAIGALDVFFDGRTLVLTQRAGSASCFAQAAQVLFECLLMRGVASTPPRWPLPLAAVLLVVLLAVSWLVSIDTWSLIAAGVWWAGAVGVAAFAGMNRTPSLISLRGAAIGLFSIVVVFALVFGTIQNTDPDLVSLASVSADNMRLGEMMLLSLSVAVSGGAFDIELQGIARFVAMVEMLLFFSTIAAAVVTLARGLMNPRPVQPATPPPGADQPVRTEDVVPHVALS